MYEVYFSDVNYAAAFGVIFGIYLILQLDTLVRDVMSFVKGWRSL